MADLDALAAKYGGQVEGSDVQNIDLIAKKYGGTVADQPAPKKSSNLDIAMAPVAGANKGVLAGLLGLPVDTVANALDLAKAAAGWAGSKVRGDTPGEWTQPMDRAQIPGTSDWIAKQINAGAGALGVRSPIENPAPDSAVGRGLYAGGQFAGMSVLPNPKAAIAPAQQAINAAIGGASGILGNAAGENAQNNPEIGVIASLLPQLIAHGAPSAVKATVRGNEQGRQDMAQRLQDFKNAGVDNPSVGLASGNGLIQGLENVLATTPGSVGPYEANKQAMLSGMQQKTNALRDTISPSTGATDAGMGIQSDLKNLFPTRVNATQSELADTLAKIIGPNSPTPVENSIATTTRLSTPIKGAEASTAGRTTGNIADLAANLKADAYGAPMFGNDTRGMRLGGVNEGAAPYNTAARVGPYGDAINGGIAALQGKEPPVQFGGGDRVPLGYTAKETAGAGPMGVPFAALKELRTEIGRQLNSKDILGTPQQGLLKQVYAAMSQDMKGAAMNSDRQTAGVPEGPLQSGEQPGLNAWNRGNAYYSRAATRAEDLNSLANNNTPAGAYNAVANSLNAGPTVYEKLRGVVSPETRSKIVGTIVDDMGKATNGQQNAEGSVWSPRTFLTNYNKLDPQSRTAMFTRLPGGAKMATQLGDIAKAADMVGQSSKIWANPSGTAAAGFARGTFGALGLGATVGLFYPPLLGAAAVTGAGMIGANQISQRLLLNPKFVNWLSQAPNVKPQDVQAQLQRLIATSKMSNDKQFQQDAYSYLDAVKQAIQDQQNTPNSK